MNTMTTKTLGVSFALTTVLTANSAWAAQEQPIRTLSEWKQYKLENEIKWGKKEINKNVQNALTEPQKVVDFSKKSQQQGGNVKAHGRVYETGALKQHNPQMVKQKQLVKHQPKMNAAPTNVLTKINTIKTIPSTNNLAVKEVDTQTLLEQIASANDPIKVHVRDLPKDSNGNIDFVALTKARQAEQNVAKQTNIFPKQTGEKVVKNYDLSSKDVLAKTKPTKVVVANDKVEQVAVATNALKSERFTTKSVSQRYYGKKQVQKVDLNQPQPTPKPYKVVDNKTSIGVSVSKRKKTVDGVYAAKSDNTANIHLKNELHIKANPTFAHGFRVEGSASYNKGDVNTTLVNKEFDNTRWLDYDVKGVYKPTITVEDGSVYALAGVGYEYSKLGRGDRHLKQTRNYAVYGGGLTKDLTQHQSVYLEGTYERDFKNKNYSEFGSLIPEQSVKSARGEKYNVELGFNSEFSNKSNVDYTVALYHSQYKNTNGYDINVNSPFGTLSYPVGATRDKETGLKLYMNFN